MSMSISENFKRGTLELVLLTLLSEQDMYGYQLSQLLENRSHKLLVVKESSMYPILYRLQNKGFITAKTEKVGVRRTRIYYHLEPTGKNYLELIKKEYMNLNQGVLYVLGYNPWGDIF